MACTVIAIHSSILGYYPIAMIAMIWAVAFDWADGLIARKMKSRNKSKQTFGGQLDILIDIVMELSPPYFFQVTEIITLYLLQPHLLYYPQVRFD